MDVWIEINGFGGELVIHPITESAFQFWRSKSKDQLLSYVLQELDEDIPENYDFALDDQGLARQWHELDEYLHVYGPDPRHAKINVDISTDGRRRRVISDESIHAAAMKMKSKILTSSFAPPIDSANASKYAVQVISVEKGCVFGGYFRGREKKDFKGLVFNTVKSISTDTGSVEMILSEIRFNDQVVDNDGLSTSGKGMFVNLIRF